MSSPPRPDEPQPISVASVGARIEAALFFRPVGDPYPGRHGDAVHAFPWGALASSSGLVSTGIPLAFRNVEVPDVSGTAPLTSAIELPRYDDWFIQ